MQRVLRVIDERCRGAPALGDSAVSGPNSLGVYGGLVIGAALGGPIADRFGITGPFWFACVGSGVFVTLMWRQLRHIAHDPRPAVMIGR